MKKFFHTSLTFLTIVGLAVSQFATLAQAVATSVIFSDGFEDTTAFANWTNFTSKWDVISNTPGAHTGSKRAEVKGNTSNNSLQRAQPTTDYTSITLSYWYKINSTLEADDHVLVQWSSDSTNWNTLQDITNASSGNWIQNTVSLPNTASDKSGFVFRFIASLDAGNDVVSFDDIQLSGVSTQKITPTLTWATPSPIVQGTALSATQLNATTNSDSAISYSPSLGTVLPFGNNTLTATISTTTTYKGASTSVIINILDVVAPTIASHADITGVEATSNAGATVTFTAPNSTDNADGVLPALCSPTSGNTFPLGTTSVTCSKTDSSGNTATPVQFSVTVVDTTAPTLTLSGSNPQVIPLGKSYSELGATATDNYDANPAVIINTGTLDTNVLGSYIISYSVTDSASNQSSATRTVQVTDQEAPAINLLGANPQTIEIGTSYTELGAEVIDNSDTGLSATMNTSNVNTAQLGNYTVVYTAMDTAGNGSTTTRPVNVTDTIAPTITLNGSATTTIKVGATYNELGATATDNSGEALKVSVTGSVNNTLVGTYTITYIVNDSSKNTATSTRTVLVEPLATDASLSSLSLSVGNISPAFSSSTLAYTATLPFGTQTVPITLATKNDTNATVNISPATTFITPNNITTVTVTAENTSITTTYTVTLSVAIAPDTTAPTITILGNNPENIFVGTTYTDAGATSTDETDGDLTSLIQTANNVSTTTAGTYTVVYTVSDMTGNTASSTRTVNVANVPVVPSPTPSSNGGGGGGGSSFYPVVIGTPIPGFTTQTQGASIASSLNEIPEESGGAPAGPLTIAIGNGATSGTDEIANQPETTGGTPGVPASTSTAEQTNQSASILESLGNIITFGTGNFLTTLGGLIIILGGVYYFLIRKRN